MRPQIIAVFVAVTILLSSSAQAGCGKWVVRYAETDFLDDPAFDDAIKSSTGSTATAGEGVEMAKEENAQDSSSSKSGSESNAEAKAMQKPEEQVPDFSGNWLVRLDELAGCTLNLILIQSKDRLQGYGSLDDKGGKIPATTTGTVSEDEVSLEVKLVKDGSLNQDDRQYKLRIPLEKDELENGKLSGVYEYYLSDELTSEGNATATKS